MRRSIIRCDFCGETRESAKDILPADWFTLRQEAQEDRHFCKGECLVRAVNSVLRLTMDIPHEPYPYCCMRHYPLPERKP